MAIAGSLTVRYPVATPPCGLRDYPTLIIAYDAGTRIAVSAMVRVDGYGRAPVKDVALFADSHPFRDPFAAVGGRRKVQSTRKPGVQMRLRRTPDSIADSRARSARPASRQQAKDADELVTRAWQRSPWGGFEDHCIAQPTSAVDGPRCGLPAKMERPAGVSGGTHQNSRVNSTRRRLERPHPAGRYADGSGRCTDGSWMTFRSESREDLAYGAVQNPQRKSQVARARVRERAIRLRRERPRLDRRLERALQYLHNRSIYPENDPDPDGTETARAAEERMRRAWRHAEDLEDEDEGRPLGDVERRRRWSDGELAYDAARHTQEEMGPDFYAEPEDYLRYTHQDTGRVAQPQSRAALPKYSAGVEQALLSQREEGMRARLQQLRNEELALRSAEARLGPPPGWQQIASVGTTGITAPATSYPWPHRQTSADLYAAAVLAQQRALAADRATAEMIQRRLALEQHNQGYLWSLAHLHQNRQAVNHLAYNQYPVVVDPDGRRWSGVPALPAREDPVKPYNPQSVVPPGWEF